MGYDDKLIEKTEHNIYSNSTILSQFQKKSKQKKTLKLAFLDIDFTLSSNTKLIPEIRKKLEALGYATIFVTARTEEIVMSKKAYKKSAEVGFARPVPNLKRKAGIYSYIDPQRIDKHLVDPDIIIGSTGTQILVKQTSGVYKKDSFFQKKLISQTPLAWRHSILDFLHQIDPEERHFSLAPIENGENYYNGNTDVFPPDLRIQLLFPSVDAKRWLLKEMRKRKQLQTFIEYNPSSTLRIIENSYEEKGKISIYITPRGGNKGSAVEHVVGQLLGAVSATCGWFKKSDIETILAVDSFPDLAMLLHAAIGTQATAIIVGGSQIGKILADIEKSDYRSDELLMIKKRLHPANRSGFYTYDIPFEIYQKEVSRELIIGERAYPNTKGPETILAFLTKEYQEKNIV